MLNYEDLLEAHYKTAPKVGPIGFVDAYQTPIGQPGLWAEAEELGRPFLVFGRGNPCPIERARDGLPFATEEALDKVAALDAAMLPGEHWRTVRGRLDASKAPVEALASFAFTDQGRLLELKGKGRTVKEHAYSGAKERFDVKRKAFRWRTTRNALLASIWPGVATGVEWSGPTDEEFRAFTQEEREAWLNDNTHDWLAGAKETVKAEGDKDLLTFNGETPHLSLRGKKVA